MKKLAAFLVLALLPGVSSVWAIDGSFDQELAKVADHDSYLAKAPGMLLYGIYEIGEAPFEPLNEPYEQTFEKKDYAFGFFKGINQGMYNVLEGMTRGTFNLVRSFVPGMGRYEDKEHQTKILPVLGG